MKQPKPIKFSPQFDRDWEFYLSRLTQEHISGAAGFSAKGRFRDAIDPDGVDAKTAFWLYDSNGKVVPTSDPDTTAAVIAFKGRGMQVTIMMWAEDLLAGLISPEEVREWSSDMPDWVLANTKATSAKMAIAKIGFVPTFISTL